MIVDCHGTDLSVPRNDDSELCAWWIAAPHKGARNDDGGRGLKMAGVAGRIGPLLDKLGQLGVRAVG